MTRPPPPAGSAPRSRPDLALALVAGFVGGGSLLVALRAYVLWRAPNYPLLAQIAGVVLSGGVGLALFLLAGQPDTTGRSRLRRAVTWALGAVAGLGSSVRPRERAARAEVVAMIVAVSLGCHGLLLLNDGTYFDGWLLRHFWANGDGGEVPAFFGRVGLPALRYAHAPHMALPNFPFSYQATTLALLTANAVLSYVLLLRLRVVAQSTALMLALLDLTSPLFFSTFEVSTNQYVLCRALFMLSLCLMLGPWSATPARRFARGASISALLWLSFNLNSLLVLFYPALGLALLARHGRAALQLRSFWLQPWRLWLLGQPVAYWAGKLFLHPSHGDQASYNRVDLLHGLRLEMLTAPVMLARDTLLPVAELAVANPGVLALIVVACIAAVVRRGPPEPSPELPPVCLVGGGVALIAAAVFPYLAVSRNLPFHSATIAHYNLLLGLPCGMVLTGVVRGACGRRMTLAGQALLAVVVCCSAFSWPLSYIHWQARGIRDEAVVHQLAQLPTDRFGVIRTVDRAEFGDERDVAHGHRLTLMLACAQGGLRTVVVPQASSDTPQPATTDELIDAWRLGNYVGEVDLSGPQARLVLERGERFPQGAPSVLEYYRLKLLDPGALPAFFSRAVAVRLIPDPPPPAESR
jgi:hypothetical protein